MSTDRTTGAIPLGDILRHHASRHPGLVALSQGDATLTYSDLDVRSERRAKLLAQNGVVQDDFVVFALGNGIEFFETTFALWKLGAVPCPVSPKMPAAECAAIVGSVSPRLFIGSPQLQFDGCKTLPAGIVPDEPGHGELPVSPVSPAWKAIASGGSTGVPKVVVAGTDGRADPASGGYAFQRAGDTVLNPGPLYHNAAFSAAHQCLFAGGHVINMARFDAQLALELIDRHRVTYVMMVPTMMSRIRRLPSEDRDRHDLSSLRVLVHLGGPCPVWLKQEWIDWIGAEKIVEVYAGTEGIGATAIDGVQWQNHRGSVGRPAPGTEMKILRADGQPCAMGEVGEIFFRTGGGASSFHYIGATKKETDGWSSLGDLGHVDEDGFLYISDRRTDLIVSGAVNIYPAEVEAAIDRHPAVRTSVVIGLPDEDLGNRVHAIVQTAPCETLDAATLSAFLAAEIAPYKLPRSFEFVTEDLRDEAGKARRALFREQRIVPESTPQS